MVYITVPAKEYVREITFDDLFKGVKDNFFEPKNTVNGTITNLRAETPARLAVQDKLYPLLDEIKKFNIVYKELIDTEDKSKIFRSFKIPKRSGGLRQIDAPNAELMIALRHLKSIFENYFLASYHTSAYAYIKGRCTIDAIKKHQANNSRWFLKLDFSNFFGSTTMEFILNRLRTIYPFNEVMMLYQGEEEIKKALSLCFLNGGLPQGTPISPTLTNLMMIPIDHAISKKVRSNSPHLCYTRYADDLLLSCDISFRWNDVQNLVIETLKEFDAPFTLNKKKTRYGSSSGRNWNLGVMLNKDNQITIGHKKKKRFKAMLYSLLTDYTNGTRWELGDIQSLGGDLSYYTMVEKEPIEKIVDDYSKKFGISVYQVIKESLKQSA